MPSLPANVDNNLNTIYQEYESAGGGSFTSPLSSFIKIQGTKVGVEVHGNGTGDFATLVASLESLGMQIESTDANPQTVIGMLPIAQLPAAAVEPGILSMTPEYLPMLF